MENKKRLNKLDQAFLEKLTAIIKREMVLGIVSLETIAPEMCITRGQLTRRVKAITGMTTQQYAMKIRMKNACLLLRDNLDMAISEIAFRCGFEDATSFSRAFRREVGVTPTTYRNENIQ